MSGERPIGRVPRVEIRAPRNRFGMPDVDAIYQEIQATKEMTLEQQRIILDKLDRILHALGVHD